MLFQERMDISDIILIPTRIFENPVQGLCLQFIHIFVNLNIGCSSVSGLPLAQQERKDTVLTCTSAVEVIESDSSGCQGGLWDLHCAPPQRHRATLCTIRLRRVYNRLSVSQDTIFTGFTRHFVHMNNQWLRSCLYTSQVAHQGQTCIVVLRSSMCICVGARLHEIRRSRWTSPVQISKVGVALQENNNRVKCPV